MYRYFAPRFWLLVLVVVVAAEAASTGRDRRRQRIWATSYDLPFSYQCPAGQALSYIHSVHNNRMEDRIWEFRCRSVPGLGDCRISPPANNWDDDMNFQCPVGEVIAGMAGMHSNKMEDRIFNFVCCKTDAQLRDCSWTQDLNSWDEPMEYSLTGGKVFHGVHSRHSNYYEDRIWRLEVCDAVAG